MATNFSPNKTYILLKYFGPSIGALQSDSIDNLIQTHSNRQSHFLRNFHFDLSFGLLDRTGSSRGKLGAGRIILLRDFRWINIVKFDSFWANYIL